MSILELIGEVARPGRTGSIEVGTPAPGDWHPRRILARAVVAATLLVAAIVALTRYAASVGDFLIGAGLLAAYLAIAHWCEPRPARDNVGFLGGLVDHPFRLSDDANRLLGMLQGILWPGRFVTVSLRDAMRFRRGERHMLLPPHDE